MTDLGTQARWKVHLTFMLMASLACLTWSWLAGKDLNWDQLNYHLYAPYNFLDDRVEKDFMAASIQGYLNPLAYVPFYLMVRANWHSLLIGSTLALLHSTCLWLIYGISRTLIPADARYRTTLLAACVAFAFLTPVFMLELGSSFNDVTTTIPVLAAVLLLMQGQPSERGGAMAVAAGFLMGSATALKLTNAVYPLAAAAFIVMARRPARQRMYDLAVYGAGAAAGYVLVAGAWSYRLFRTYGNPFFPWFNAWFRSPDFPAFNITSYRFMPETVSDFVRFPFVMLDLGRPGYTESISPDGRPLALLLILVVAGLAALIRHRSGRAAASRNGVREARVGSVYPAAVAFTLLSYILWLVTSGSGRFAMPLLLFIGPMIPASMLASSASRRLLAYALGALLLVHATMVEVIGPTRWSAAAWTTTWFDLDVPETLRARPFLYLSLTRQPAAFLAPFLNPGSSFVNLVGQVSLAFDRPGGSRLRAMLDRHRPNIRTLMVRSIPTGNVPPLSGAIALQNRMLGKVGLEVDAADCIWFATRGSADLHPDTASRALESSDPVANDRIIFLTCATKPAQANLEDPQLDLRRARAERVFELLEKQCPRLFSPAGPYTDRYSERLLRNYANSDTELWELGGVVEYRGWFGVPAAVGRVDDIVEGKVRFDCRVARVRLSVDRE